MPWQLCRAYQYLPAPPKTQFLIFSLKFASPGFHILVSSIICFFSFLHHSSCPPNSYIQSLSKSCWLPFQPYPRSDHLHPITLVWVTVIMFLLTPHPNLLSSKKSGSLRKDNSGILPLRCLFKYSRTNLYIWINARIKDPNARDPVWYLDKDKMRIKVKIYLLLTKRALVKQYL